MAKIERDHDKEYIRKVERSEGGGGAGDVC